MAPYRISKVAALLVSAVGVAAMRGGRVAGGATTVAASRRRPGGGAFAPRGRRAYAGAGEGKLRPLSSEPGHDFVPGTFGPASRLVRARRPAAARGAFGAPTPIAPPAPLARHLAATRGVGDDTPPGRGARGLAALQRPESVEESEGDGDADEGPGAPPLRAPSPDEGDLAGSSSDESDGEGGGDEEGVDDPDLRGPLAAARLPAHLSAGGGEGGWRPGALPPPPGVPRLTARALAAAKRAAARDETLLIEDGDHGLRESGLGRRAWFVLSRLSLAGHGAYVVGGAVRDLLLGRVPKDVDVLTTADEKAVKALFRRAFVVGRAFPVVHVIVDGSPVEVSTFGSNTRAAERAAAAGTGGRRGRRRQGGSAGEGAVGEGPTEAEAEAARGAAPPCEEGDGEAGRGAPSPLDPGALPAPPTRAPAPIPADLAGHMLTDTPDAVRPRRRRGKAAKASLAAEEIAASWSEARKENARSRDFTANGLLYDPITRILYDYVGGVGDLAARRLRTIADPAESFQHDPARMLRAVRLAARAGLAMDRPTASALRRHLPLVAQLPTGRLSMELNALLAHGSAARSAELLWSLGALDALVLPIARAMRSEGAGRRGGWASGPDRSAGGGAAPDRDARAPVPAAAGPGEGDSPAPARPEGDARGPAKALDLDAVIRAESTASLADDADTADAAASPRRPDLSVPTFVALARALDAHASPKRPLDPSVWAVALVGTLVAERCAAVRLAAAKAAGREGRPTASQGDSDGDIERLEREAGEALRARRARRGSPEGDDGTGDEDAIVRVLAGPAPEATHTSCRLAKQQLEVYERIVHDAALELLDGCAVGERLPAGRRGGLVFLPSDAPRAAAKPRGGKGGRGARSEAAPAIFRAGDGAAAVPGATRSPLTGKQFAPLTRAAADAVVQALLREAAGRGEGAGGRETRSAWKERGAFSTQAILAAILTDPELGWAERTELPARGLRW